MSGGKSWIAGVGDTPYGRLDGEAPISLMPKAATAALAQASFARHDIGEGSP